MTNTDTDQEPTKVGEPDSSSDDERTGDDRRESTPTAAETACFETGIKFGSLYHQFAGTPVTPESATELARAMESAIENQPHCREVTVDIREEELAGACEHGYTELTGRFMTVEIVVDYEGLEVTARMAMEDGYPLMTLDDISGTHRSD